MSMIQNNGEIARPNVRTRLKVMKLSGRASKLSAFVVISIRPVTILDVASVMMKLLIPVRTTNNPFTKPIKAPNSNPTAMATNGWNPHNSIIPPTNMATNPPIAPIERFISPAERAIICAYAMVISTAAKRMRVKRLNSVRKPSARQTKNDQKSMVISSKPYRDQLCRSDLIIGFVFLSKEIEL